MKYFLSVIFLLTSIVAIPLSVDAQENRQGGDAVVNSTTSGEFSINEDVGLREIRVPIFSSFIDFNTENASVLTWITFLGGIFTVGLVVFWIYLIIKAGVKGMQSQGNAEKLSEAFKQVQSVLIGAALTLIFPLFLSLIGLFLGIGTIFSWPKMFQFCDQSALSSYNQSQQSLTEQFNSEQVAKSINYQYYFQALLGENNQSNIADQVCGLK